MNKGEILVKGQDSNQIIKLKYQCVRINRSKAIFFTRDRQHDCNPKMEKAFINLINTSVSISIPYNEDGLIGLIRRLIILIKTDDSLRKRWCLDVILTEMGHLMSSY